MALKDTIGLGVSLPHRSPDPIAVADIRQVAQRAEALGFQDVWVTENTLDHVYSFDPVAILTYAAAVTTRIRVGVSVVVLPVHDPIHVAHQFASLDQLSGGRAILGIGLGRAEDYADFRVPLERRVRRLHEGIALIKALWTQPTVDYHGQLIELDGAGIPLKPVQQPHVPIWLGGSHPDAVRRAAAVADAWMGAGGQSTAGFGRSVPLLREALEKAGRDPVGFPVSKRVFLAVDEDAARARADVSRWFTEVYRNPEGTDTTGVHGTPAQVREQLESLVAMGASHLLLNPVFRYSEQVEALAEVVGFA